MKITEVTNSIKVGDFKINRKFLEIKDYKKEKKDPLLQTNLVDIDFSTENEISKILKKKICHVYFFCCDENIYKIGGSNSSIKSNLKDYYIDQAISGGFSNSRFFCHLKIYANLKAGKKVTAWVITYNNVDVEVKDLKNKKLYNVGLNAEELERICKEQYHKIEKKDPKWNLQEGGRSYPTDVQKLMDSYKSLRAKKKHKAKVVGANRDLLSHFRRCKNYNLV